MYTNRLSEDLPGAIGVVLEFELAVAHVPQDRSRLNNAQEHNRNR